MQYLKIEFTVGVTGQGYQIVDPVSGLGRVTDLNGDDITVHAYEYNVIDYNPPVPAWGTP